MHYSYLLFFLSFSLLAQSKARIEVLNNPQTMEDFDHQFKGCPENSECDQVMGLQLGRWKELITKMKDEKIPQAKKSQAVEVFRSKYGIPVEFYTHQKSQLGFKPLLYSSPCPKHGHKDKDKKVLRGIAFIKSLTPAHAVIWRDQTQIEVPVGPLIIPQDVKVFYPEPVIYQLPLGDQPLFIKNKNLYVLREDDGFFYMLKVSANGEWKIEDVDFTKLSSWEERRQNVACPLEKVKIKSKYFESDFCKTVWDEDTKRTVVVKMRLGCPI